MEGTTRMTEPSIDRAPPVWLLDVDGVVNAVTAPRRKPPLHVWPDGQWVDTKVWGNRQRWRIVAAQPVLDFIRSVHELGRAEVRWHTTWQDSANQLGEALGLPEFPVQDAPEFAEPEWPGSRGWWKLPAVWRVLAEGRPVLWTDDDAKTDLRPEQKATLAAAGCRVIAPDPFTGLTPKHLRQIDEFLPKENANA
jgi:hypothetical protein